MRVTLRQTSLFSSQLEDPPPLLGSSHENHMQPPTFLHKPLLLTMD